MLLPGKQDTTVAIGPYWHALPLGDAYRKLSRAAIFLMGLRYMSEMIALW